MKNLREREIWIPAVELQKVCKHLGIDIYPFGDESLEPFRISMRDDRRLNIHTRSGLFYASRVIAPDNIGDSVVLKYDGQGKLNIWVNNMNLNILNNPVRRILSKTVIPQRLFREDHEFGRVFNDEFERISDLRGTNMSLVTATDACPRHKVISGYEIMYVFKYASSNSDRRRIQRIYGCGKYSQKSLNWFKAEMAEFMIRPSGAFDHLPESAEIQTIAEPKVEAKKFTRPKIAAPQTKKPKPTVLTLPHNMQIGTAALQPLRPNDLKKNPRINPAMSALAALLPQVQSPAESV